LKRGKRPCEKNIAKKNSMRGSQEVGEKGQEALQKNIVKRNSMKCGQVVAIRHKIT